MQTPQGGTTGIEKNISITERRAYWNLYGVSYQVFETWKTDYRLIEKELS